MSRNRCYDFNDTVPTDYGPLDAERCRPRRRTERMSRSPGKRLILAVVLVALCAALVMVSGAVG